MALFEESSTLPVTLPLFESKVIGGAVVVLLAVTVTDSEAGWNPFAEAVSVTDPAGTLASVYAPLASVIVVSPAPVAVAPAIPLPELSTTVPVIVPGFVGASWIAGTPVLPPAAAVTLCDPLWYPWSVAVT